LTGLFTALWCRYKNCPDTWEVKRRIAEDEEGFVSKLKEAWSNRA